MGGIGDFPNRAAALRKRNSHFSNEESCVEAIPFGQTDSALAGPRMGANTFQKGLMS